MRLLFSVLLLVCSIVGTSQSADTGPVMIYHVNGVDTDRAGAIKNAVALRMAWNAQIPAPAARQISFNLLLNPTDGKIKDFIEAGVLRGYSPKAVLLAWIAGKFEGLPDDLADELRDYLTQVGVQASGVTAEHTLAYRKHIFEKNKIIVVPHSQGNLFANAAYRNLTSGEQKCMYVVGVAVPAPLEDIPASKTYVSLHSDSLIAAMALLHTAAPTNTDHDDTNGLRTDNSFGHAFTNAYLVGGTRSRVAILGHIQSAVDAERTAGTPCKPDDPPPPSPPTPPPPIQPPPSGTARALAIYDVSTVYGRTTTTYTSTTTSTNDGVTTTSSFSQDNYQPLVPLMTPWSICKVGDQWIGVTYTRNQHDPGDVPTYCSGKTARDQVSTVTVSGSTLTVKLEDNYETDLSCDTSVGNSMNRWTNKQSSAQPRTIIIDLNTGAGTFTGPLNQSSSYVQTYSWQGGLKTSSSATTTTGGANASWGAGPLNLVGSFTNLAAGQPIPEICTSNGY